MFEGQLAEIMCTEKPILLFGASKAGKSTFMARLLSDETPDEFLGIVDKVSTGKIEFTTKQNVVISGLGPSCTLIPQLKRVGGRLNVVDLPGFQDSEAHRNIMIQLFHKATLSEIIRKTSPLIVVVIDAKMLHDHANFTNQYHTPLKDLFGEGAGYEAFLQNAHFVFSHMDQFEKLPQFQTGMTPRSVMVAELSCIEDMLTTRLYQKMIKNHIVVDYRVHSQSECIQLLTDEVNKAAPVTGLPAPPVQNVSITFNQANTWLIDDCAHMLRLATDMSASGMQEIEDRYNEFESKAREYTSIAEQHTSLRKMMFDDKVKREKIEKDYQSSMQNLSSRQGALKALLESEQSLKKTQDNMRTTLSSTSISRHMRFRAKPKAFTDLSGPNFGFFMHLAPEFSSAVLLMVDPNSAFSLAKFDEGRKSNAGGARQAHMITVSATKGHPPNLKEAMQSDGSKVITADSHTNFDIIVVDTKSLDGSEEMGYFLSVLEADVRRNKDLLTEVQDEMKELNSRVDFGEKSIAKLDEDRAANSDIKIKLTSDLQVAQDAVSYYRAQCFAVIDNLGKQARERFLSPDAIGPIESMIRVFQTHQLATEAVNPFTEYKTICKDFCTFATRRRNDVEVFENKSCSAVNVLTRTPSDALQGARLPPPPSSSR